MADPVAASDTAVDNADVAYLYTETSTGAFRKTNVTPTGLGFVSRTGTQTLENKSLQDSTTYFVDNSDATKKLQLQLSGFSTGQTRVLTPPNYDGTIATLAGTESFSNKTLDDSTTFFADNSDATKKFQFQASSIATATTRTYTVPNKDGTVAMLSDIGMDLLVKTNSAQDFSALDYTTSVFSADYDIYVFEIRKLYATVENSNALMLRVFDNGSLVTSGYEYQTQEVSGTTQTNTALAGQGAFQLISSSIVAGATSNDFVTGWVKVYAYPLTASGGVAAGKDCVVHWQMYQRPFSGVQRTIRGSGRVVLSTSTSPSQLGVRFYPSISNEINGVFEVYGVRNS
jgi:hypothetical protein